MKAAVHYTVGQICEEVQNESDDPALDKDFEYSKQVISVIAETTYRYMSTMATDLELFAKYVHILDINLKPELICPGSLLIIPGGQGMDNKKEPTPTFG